MRAKPPPPAAAPEPAPAPRRNLAPLVAVIAILVVAAMVLAAFLPTGFWSPIPPTPTGTAPTVAPAADPSSFRFAYQVAGTPFLLRTDCDARAGASARACPVAGPHARTRDADPRDLDSEIEVLPPNANATLAYVGRGERGFQRLDFDAGGGPTPTVVLALDGLLEGKTLRGDGDATRQVRPTDRVRLSLTGPAASGDPHETLEATGTFARLSLRVYDQDDLILTFSAADSIRIENFGPLVGQPAGFLQPLLASAWLRVLEFQPSGTTAFWVDDIRFEAAAPSRDLVTDGDRDGTPDLAERLWGTDPKNVSDFPAADYLYPYWEGFRDGGFEDPPGFGYLLGEPLAGEATGAKTGAHALDLAPSGAPALVRLAVLNGTRLGDIFRLSFESRADPASEYRVEIRILLDTNRDSAADACLRHVISPPQASEWMRSTLGRASVLERTGANCQGATSTRTLLEHQLQRPFGDSAVLGIELVPTAAAAARPFLVDDARLRLDHGLEPSPFPDHAQFEFAPAFGTASGLQTLSFTPGGALTISAALYNATGATRAFTSADAPRLVLRALEPDGGLAGGSERAFIPTSTSGHRVQFALQRNDFGLPGGAVAWCIGLDLASGSGASASMNSIFYNGLANATFAGSPELARELDDAYTPLFLTP